MAELRERVAVKTPSGYLNGELVVGADGLPRLTVTGKFAANGLIHRDIAAYSPSTLPAAWSLIAVSFPLGPLFHAWRDIEDLREEIRQAQNVCDGCELDGEIEAREPDPSDRAKAWMEREGLR